MSQHGGLDTACPSWSSRGRGFLCASFFFQAEDGIRARTVTGVQTCALPIFLRRAGADRGRLVVASLAARQLCLGRHQLAAERPAEERWGRSEERRVGKARRSTRPRYREKRTSWLGRPER